MTPCSDLIELFFARIEKDRDFFDYYNITNEDEIMKIAKIRATNYLHEAVARLVIDTTPSIEFKIIKDDEEKESFEDDLTEQEKFILVSLMYEYYLSRDISYLKLLDVNYTSSDLQVYDPSNARRTFMEMYQEVCTQNKTLLDRYKNTDRITGKLKTLNFDLYDIT